MGITSVSSSNVTSTTAITASKPVQTQQDITLKDEANVSTNTLVEYKQAAEANGNITTDQNLLSEKEIENVTEGLNNFMQSMNTDISFALHTRTKTLMIQVEDGKTHKVLKEFPARELLDMVARMRDCIGVFLDKKA